MESRVREEYFRKLHTEHHVFIGSIMVIVIAGFCNMYDSLENFLLFTLLFFPMAFCGFWNWNDTKDFSKLFYLCPMNSGERIAYISYTMISRNPE